MTVKEILAEVESRTQTRDRGQGQQHKTIRGQRPTLSKPRTGMLEAMAKDQEHNAQVFLKKQLQSLHKFTAMSLARSPARRRKKKVMTLAHFLTNQKKCCFRPQTGHF